MKKKILLTKQIILNMTKELSDFELTIWDEEQDGKLTNDKLKEILPSYDGIISMLSDRLDQETLKDARELKIISQYAVGFNNIDIDYCQRNNIAVTNTPDVLSHATAELGFALLLNLARKVSTSSESAKKGHWKGWEPCGHIGRSLRNLKLGIIGPGRIGREFTHLCKNAFNHEVFYYSRKRKEDFEEEFSAKFLSLNEMIEECDVISIHCPLTQETKHLLNKSNLSLMKNDAILINTARGEIINQADLIEITKMRKDLSFGLDVTDPEPLKAESPLYSSPNVLITPHIGSATREARREMGKIVCKSIKSCFSGDEINNMISY